jgi:D-beta-D-heptose 7-phosphate kinase/D-beta-D-heptose 1-phosphate adenosyltransferase
MPNRLNLLTRHQIIVIGDVMLDRYIWGDVSRISPEAPVPVVRVAQRTEAIGGAGNVAANLAGLSCSPVLVCMRGNDEEGEILENLCLENGITPAFLVARNRATTTKTRVMARKQQLFRLDNEDTRILDETEKKELLAIFEDRIPEAEAVVISDYGKGILQTPGLTQEIIALCKKYRLPSLVDPKGRDWERYNGATCITPNTSELETVAEIPVDHDERLLAETVIRIKKHHKVKCLVMTRGPKGMCVADSDDPPVFLQTQAKEVFDVSGAGDTVIATIAAGIAGGLTFIKASELANIAAGIVVGKLGTQPVSFTELELFINLSHHQGNGSGGDTKLESTFSAKKKIEEWKLSGETVVFTNGCFDLLHPGHVDLLRKAKSLGRHLVIGLNSDESVTRLKGPTRPILAQNDRAAMLSALSCVDMVVVFGEDTPLELLTVLKPDILVKGSDYKPEDVVGKDLVESYGGKIALIPLVDGYSTSGIEKRIRERS